MWCPIHVLISSTIEPDKNCLSAYIGRRRPRRENMGKPKLRRESNTESQVAAARHIRDDRNCQGGI